MGVLPHRQWGHHQLHRIPLLTDTALLTDTEIDDDVSSSVVATRKMALVDHSINNNSQMQMDDMVPYHKFSNCTDQQVHDKLSQRI